MVLPKLEIVVPLYCHPRIIVVLLLLKCSHRNQAIGRQASALTTCKWHILKINIPMGRLRIPLPKHHRVLNGCSKTSLTVLWWKKINMDMVTHQTHTAVTITTQYRHRLGTKALPSRCLHYCILINKDTKHHCVVNNSGCGGRACLRSEYVQVKTIFRYFVEWGTINQQRANLSTSIFFYTQILHQQLINTTRC